MRKLPFLLSLLWLFLHPAAIHAAKQTVGVILTKGNPYYEAIFDVFKTELQHNGVDILVQRPSPDTIAWHNAARRYVVLGVDAILTFGGAATLATLDESGKTPVVFAAVSRPDKLGISRKNVTGMSANVQPAKLLKILKHIRDFKKIHILCSDAEPDTMLQKQEVEALGKQMDFTIACNLKNHGHEHDVTDVDALLLTSSSMRLKNLEQHIAKAREAKIPSAALISGAEEKGILLTMSANSAQLGSGAARMVSDIVAGKKPFSIPIDNSAKIDTTLNLREAKALGFKVPLNLVSIVTKVIK